MNIPNTRTIFPAAKKQLEEGPDWNHQSLDASSISRSQLIPKSAKIQLEVEQHLLQLAMESLSQNTKFCLNYLFPYLCHTKLMFIPLIYSPQQVC